jgi:arginine exporter protein ArgO
MPDVDAIAVLVGTVAALVLGGAYYAAFGAQLATVSEAAAAQETTPPSTLAIEVLRNLLVAAVVAGIAAQGEIDEWAGGLLLGLALWVGFPLVLWVGAVFHENAPAKLAVIHAGDWLVKLLAISVLIAVLQ